MPPTPTGLAAWSQCFRSAATFANYVGYLKLGCHVLGIDAIGVDGPLLKRAKMALKKREAAPKERKFIQWDLLGKLVALARDEGDLVSAMLYLASYTFLLRVPSEGLPMTTGGNPMEAPCAGAHSSVAVVNDELVLRLAKRKTRSTDLCCGGVACVPLVVICALSTRWGNGYRAGPLGRSLSHTWRLIGHGRS